MSNIEKIRQEIERRLQRENEILWNAKKRGIYPSPSCEYNLLTLTSLRDFIDSLPEQKPSEELEEAARRYAIPAYMKDVDENFLDEYPYDPVAEKGFIAGAEWQKEQMMKEVKYGVVCKNGERDEEDVWIELNPGSLPDYKDTDPIDFIIVKQ